MTLRQVFLDTKKEGRNWFRLRREGDKIIYEKNSYDSEKNLEYFYAGEFSVEDYKRALKAAAEKGIGKIEMGNYSLQMTQISGSIELKFKGVPDPKFGGAASSTFICMLENLLLKEEQPGGKPDASCTQEEDSEEYIKNHGYDYG